MCGAEYIQDYERQFSRLMEERRIEHALDRSLLDRPAVLLCSEPKTGPLPSAPGSRVPVRQVAKPPRSLICRAPCGSF